MLSTPLIVDRRWATSTVVRPLMSRSNASCSTHSDSASRALVASSKRSIVGSLRTALAIAILCFWPPESWTPLSPTGVLYPSGNPLTKPCTLAARAASMTSDSVAPSFP
ncbi:hypothetical protein TorRG33x02_265050 [Trema orientale]|uniref:Uncharacterized protein n=2 Tax=Cannabaceae TaxID=3481 RepID=A0A2P5B1L4_PARAD|nr:hypothetical protein PanWU01x14_280100 [Parasponia andersonii]PON67332.1 hypothetical protein TorRG33x02_265050 [Trema orientale]